MELEKKEKNRERKTKFVFGGAFEHGLRMDQNVSNNRRSRFQCADVTYFVQ